MKHLFYIILISLFCFNITTFSQNPEWINYTNGDLINATVIEGDFVWVGTSVGLVKTDKISGDQIFYNKFNSGLPSNRITCLAIDDFGNKWIGTSEGLVKFNGIEWIIYNASNSGLRDNYIQCIAIDDSGNKWIGTSEGLIKFDGTDWTLFTHANSDLPSNSIICISIDKSGNKWIGTYPQWAPNTGRTGGLAKFDGTDWTIYDESNSGLPDLYISCIDIDESGNTWVGTEDGLAKFDGTDWTVYNTLNSGLPYSCIESIAIDSFDNVWIGIYYDYDLDGRGGFVKFDGSDWILYNEDNTDLPGKGISSIAIDSEGNKWIGTYNIWGYSVPYGKGLVKYDDTNWTKINTSSSGLPNNAVKFITIDKLGNKWIGNGNEDVNVVKFDGTNWTIYNETNSGLPANVNCVAIDDFGVKWFGTYGRGIVEFDDYDWYLYNESNSSLPSDYITCIATRGNTDYWFGSSDGLESFNFIWNSSNSGLPSNFVNCVVIDEGGNKWIGTYKGLAKNYCTNWDVYDKSNSGLPNNRIACIVIDDTNNKWIGTLPEYNSSTNDYEGGGLAKFDGIDWTVYNESNSDLPSNRIYCIAIDDSDNKWIGTNNGLVKFDGTNWTVYNTSNSGLLSSFINCIAIDEAGNKWIGTYGGLSVFNEGGVVSVEENSNEIELLPNEYVLSQNYPNPFNPSTTIKYAIPLNVKGETSNVKLIIYDVLGREVATLVNKQQKAGYYEVNFNASSLTSGIYFYHIAIHSDKLNAGSFVETKKMILLR